jgi:hypothetical protein
MLLGMGKKSRSEKSLIRDDGHLSTRIDGRIDVEYSSTRIPLIGLEDMFEHAS